MARIDIGIIGGTGIGDRLRALGGIPIHIPTEHGAVRGRLLEHAGKNVMLMSRHSAGHKVPPHRVNYLGMAAALKNAGASVCLSTAAVGSLREDWPNGTMAICTDFVDVTARNITAHDRAVVHVDFSDPYPLRARNLIKTGASKAGVPFHEKAIYVNGNGPRYETPYEIQLYRRMGGDVVGMTAASEAIAMRETGVDYACIAVCTNLAAGIAGVPLSHEEVVEEMERSGEKAVRILLAAVESLS